MYDTVIIGGGPAGYLAAERLGRAKKSVLVIEERRLGGTCLNEGCIPTKTLLNSAKLYAHAKEAHKFGVKAQDVSFDWTAMQNWKNEVIFKLRQGVEGRLKRLGVEVTQGRGEIMEAPSGNRPAMVKSISPNGKTAEHEAKTLLVCAGSSSAKLPIPGIQDNPLTVYSDGLLETKSVPGSLAVIGGGVIGLEFASLFSALGSRVTVIEMLDEILPFMDRELSPILRRAMKDVDFKLRSKVDRIEGGVVTVSSTQSQSMAPGTHPPTADGARHHISADLVLLAAGRGAVTDTWGAKAVGVDIDKSGIRVDDRMRTNIPGIWAAGDVNGKSLLAHSAYRMGEVAADDIIAMLDGIGDNRKTSNRMRYNAIPWAVYGITESCGVGLTEQEAEEKGIVIIKASVLMKTSGRFAAENTFQAPGLVKVIARADNRRIIGIHAVGAYSSEFIWGGAALIEQEFRVDEVKQLILPHPTVSELIKDAAWEL
jgi:dihydrolipoamide dehydrogenase